MRELHRTNINLDAVSFSPREGYLADGTKFLVSESSKYRVTLPHCNVVGIRLYDEDVDDHSSLCNALESLTGQEVSEDDVATMLDEYGAIAIGNHPQHGELAEQLRKEI